MGRFGLPTNWETWKDTILKKLKTKKIYQLIQHYFNNLKKKLIMLQKEMQNLTQLVSETEGKKPNKKTIATILKTLAAILTLIANSLDN